MQKRKCSICQKNISILKFYKSGKYFYPQCKVCKKKKDKATYHKNKYENERRKFNDKKSFPIRKLRAQIFVYDILSKSKCADCGENRLETLDFDHVSGEKDRNISAMVLKGLKIENIKKEIEKCDIRCANCHRIKTFRERNWSRADWNSDTAKLELEKLIKESTAMNRKRIGRPKTIMGKQFL